LQCSNVGKRRPESRKQGAANRLLLAAERVLKELVSRNIPGIHAGNCAVHKYTKSQSGVQNRTNGGESVLSTLLIKQGLWYFQVESHGSSYWALARFGTSKVDFGVSIATS
jgi:hypothetical protein